MPNISDAYGRDLDLNLLRVFAIVAEEESITRAAARLYVTQPAVSAAMRRLTSFVGSDLVTRQGRGVVLTSRGTELLAAARAHLRPLIAATMAAPLFEPHLATATIRVGLADGLVAMLLPDLLAAMRAEAPQMRVVVTPVQFRTVEALLLGNTVDFAVTVADDLPRSILRQELTTPRSLASRFVCLYDSRVAKLPKVFSEREYFAREHVAVSYAGDLRGIVEDAFGKSRKVRVSVPAFSYVVDVIDGSPLLATVPALYAQHIQQTRPYLRIAPLPFLLEGVSLELLWSRVTDEDAAPRFVRALVAKVAGALEGKLEPRRTRKSRT
jgi:LysR family transcriptional activator of mexEF-oprN operon